MLLWQEALVIDQKDDDEGDQLEISDGSNYVKKEPASMR